MVYVEARGSAAEEEESLRALDFVTLGWSPVGTVSVIGVGVAMVLSLVVVALWPLKSAMPVAAGCSMAIAAACHPPRAAAALDRAKWEQELSWGAVCGNNGVWRCSFTSDKGVLMPVEGERYE